MGSRVPSRVSRRWVSPHGAPLPSSGSRRARFPTFSGTMKALRLPARAFPVPYGFGSGLHMLPRVRVRRGAPGAVGTASGPGGLGQPVCPVPAYAHGHARDLSGFLALHPIPLPGSQTPAGSDRTSPFAVPPMLPPGPTRRRLQHEHDIGAQPRASVSAAYASRAALPPPMQGSLPAGGLRLCREGVELSGSR